MKGFQNKKQKDYSGKETTGNTRKKPSYPDKCSHAKWKKLKKSEMTKRRQEKEEQIHSSNSSPKEFSANKKWQKKGKHKKIKEIRSSPVQHSQNGPHKNSLSAKPLTKNNVQIPNGRTEKRKKKLKKNRSQNSPTEPLIKVHTHAALYKNPEEFSSNWKKFLKVCSVVGGVLLAFAFPFLFIYVR